MRHRKCNRKEVLLPPLQAETEVPTLLRANREPFEILTESVESEWIDGLRTDGEDARNKIDCLWAELWAICVWDRIDSLQTHDETSWHARRLLFRCLARRGAIWRLRTHVIYAQARF